MSKSKKLRTLQKQAKMLKPSAMYRLGIWYSLGKQVEKSDDKAADWIGIAAELGYKPAQKWLDENVNGKAD